MKSLIMPVVGAQPDHTQRNTTQRSATHGTQACARHARIEGSSGCGVATTLGRAPGLT